MQRDRRRNLTAVVSVHDVMPETLPEVQEILAMLQRHKVSPVTLLVVPGRNWHPDQLDWLLEQQRQGMVLAGHGWQHQVTKRATLYHKLHGLFLSRMVAEHLSLSEQQITRLIERCHGWFVEQGFEAPALYVPPAWAMGGIQHKTLDTLPFSLYETLAGVYGTSESRLLRLPLTGYEADSLVRTSFLAGWNRFNEARARRSGRPLRISIHPGDLSLGLAAQIEAQLGRVDCFADYRQLF